MSRKITVAAAVSVAAVTAAVTVSLTYGYAMDNFNRKVADVTERQAMYTKLSEIDRKVRQDYIGKLDEAALRDGLCAGYVGGLSDPHAQYLSAEKYKAYLGSAGSSGTGAGIATVQDRDGNMEVIEVAPGSPAEKAGVKKGDTIVAVDGDDVARITYAAALNRLDGTAGTRVKFRILRRAAGADSAAAAQPFELTVVRGEYRQQTVTSSLINGNIAFIRISRFADGTPQEFNTALSRLIRGAAGLVVDLRNNSAGSVASAAQVLDTLLPAGDTVASRDRTGKVTVEFTSKANEIPLPVSVLVNGGTSGAAELFAADVRDFRKGLVVGEKTAGSSAKVEAVPLSDGSAVLLPVAEYLPAGKKSFGGAGVAADIGKGLSEEQRALLERNGLPPAQDPQVSAAVASLARQGAAVLRMPEASSSAVSGAPSAPAAVD